jgi:hypothetical protein
MIRYVTALVLSVFALGAWAQTSPPQHQHPNAQPPPNTIDGAKYPELIPDKTAYRLYFVSVAESKHSDFYFQTLGLTPKEVLSASNALTSFKTQYDALVAEYNDTESTKSGNNAGTAAFIAKRDALVDSTRAAFAKVLSSSRMTALDSHVQSEKRHMQYARDPLLSFSGVKKPRLVPAAFHPRPQEPPCVMKPYYDNYVNFSIDSAQPVIGPHTIYSTAVVEGYAQVSGFCLSLHHGAVWSNMNNDSNPFQFGLNVTPPSYISVSNSDSAVGVPGQVINVTGDVQIICSTVGTFYNVDWFLDAEVAYTRSLNTGVTRGTTTCPSGDQCTIWTTFPYCTPSTTPPDWSPNLYVAPSDLPEVDVAYIDAITACVRITGTGQSAWVCLPSAASIGWPQSFNLSPASCTYTP